jgi:chromosome partitioning protein
MRVLSFVTQKGGAGKTTLTICCAVAAERTGHKTLILDMDPQGTAEAWYQDREAETPKLACVTAAELPKALDGARAEKYDFVLIDTPGRDEPAVAAAIRVSDFCLIPCRPSPADMKATPPTVAAIQRLAKPAAFVLTQTPPRGPRIREATRGLGMLGIVAPVHLVSRHSFQDAQAGGFGVTEYEPDGKAAEEVKQLWTWITRKLKKLVDE